MRTTVDIPQNLRQKLITEAARKRLKGFSPLVVEALRQYFSTKADSRDEIIANLRGCLSMKEAERDLTRIAEGRKNWRI